MSAIRVVRPIGEDDGVEYGVEDERRVEERGTERNGEIANSWVRVSRGFHCCHEG